MPVRYCFKRDPNVTLLVEQEAEVVARDESRVHSRIRKMLEERLAGQQAIVWPRKPGEVPDREPQFLIAYLPLEFAAKPAQEQHRSVLALCEQFANRPREFRNGLGMAVPAADQVEVLRRSVRYLLAVERVQRKWREHNLTTAQKSQLKERDATEKAATESALLRLYGEVWLPASGDKTLTFDAVSLGGRPLQTTLDEKKRALIHQRLMELLTTVQRRVFGTLAPGKIVELYKLGEPGTGPVGIATDKVLAGFYEFFGFPRLLSAEAVRKAVARGVETGLFAYVTARPPLADDGRYQIDRSRVAFERSVADDEIDLDSGFLIVPAALPEKPLPPDHQPSDSDADDGDVGKSGSGDDSRERETIRGTARPHLTIQTSERSPCPSPRARATCSRHGTPSPTLPTSRGKSLSTPRLRRPRGTTRPSWRMGCSNRSANWDSSRTSRPKSDAPAASSMEVHSWRPSRFGSCCVPGWSAEATRCATVARVD